MAKSNTLLWVGGGVAAFMLLSKGGLSALSFGPKTNAAPGTLVPNAPAPPSVYSQAYYNAYQYPAMIAANPNVSNPNYQLTGAEANQYLQNYMDIAQWSRTFNNKTPQQAAQYHWTTYGVAERRTFMPLIPQDLTPYTPPPANKNASSGNSFSSILGTVASVAIAFAGTESNRLNNADVDLIFKGSAIIKEILPMYASSDLQLTRAIDDRLNNVLSDYI